MKAAAHPSLTDRDTEILSVLTRRVRVLSDAQIAREWWTGASDPIAAARKSLRRLVNAGLLAHGTGMVHPILPLDAAICIWSPEQPPPDAEKVSYRLKSRWTGVPVASRWFSASDSAASLMGGFGGRVPRPSELTHDIHMAELFLKLQRSEPQTAQTWASESELYSVGLGRNQRLPDAMVRDAVGWRVIEFGGQYAPPKLRDFHDFCQARSLRYEIW